jgi:Restriction endonuclease
MNFATAANQLREQEFARIIAAVPPTLESLRSLTPAAFRVQIALMMERLGHAIITEPGTADLVTTKDGRKFITACATPADLMPTAPRDLKRLHQAVIAGNAEGGIHVTPRSFTADAEEFARTLPIVRLVDGEKLMQSIARSFEGIDLPDTYKTMCCLCGDIVRHRLDKGEALPCANGHMVPATIALGSVKPPKPAAATASGQSPKPAVRPLSRREIRAHNYKYEARMMKKPRAR